MKLSKRFREGNGALPIYIANLLICIYMAIPAFASDTPSYYFIYSEPQSYLNPTEPFPMVVYKLDSIDNFESITEFKSDTPSIWFVNCFPRNRLFLVGFGYMRLSGIRIYSMDKPASYEDIIWRDDRYVISSHLQIDPEGGAILDIGYAPDEKARLPDSRDFKINIASIVDQIFTGQNEYRLAGPAPVHSSGYSDIEKVEIGSDGGVIIKREEAGPHMSALNNLSFATHFNSNWNVIAYEPDYIALLEVPTDLKSRKLLVFSTDTKLWSDYTINGGQTRIRPIGEWLVGTVTESDPDSDLSERFALPPRLLNQVILINSTDGREIIVSPGNDCEVLYIDSTRMVYRVADELYVAELEGRELHNGVLLSKSPIVKHIHWAFPTNEE